MNRLIYQAQLYTSRMKRYTWPQVWSMYQVLPSDFDSSRDDRYDIIDPNYFLTQSAKNYSGSAYLFRYYSSNTVFLPTSDNHGVQTRLVQSLTEPFWANAIVHDSWYWKQYAACKYLRWLSILPGVKRVYIIGSTHMRISAPESDTDIMIECYPGHVLAVRLWVKLFILKLLGVDVHPFRYEVLLWIARVFEKRYPGNRTHKFVHWCERKISDFKYRKGLKIDAGIFFDSHEILQTVYGTDPRQDSWLWSGMKVDFAQNYSIPKTETLSGSRIYPPFSYHLSKQKRWVWLIKKLCTIIFWVPYSVSIPFAWLQIPFYRLKNRNQSNFYFSRQCVGFVPRYYKDGYLTQYT